jgi:CheY-like chemotaxis protein
MHTPQQLLVVDDDEGVREFMAMALASVGYEVVSAPDAAAALELLATSQPAVILLDMLMPNVDGWEFARLYEQRPGPHAPIIALHLRSLSSRLHRRASVTYSSVSSCRTITSSRRRRRPSPTRAQSCRPEAVHRRALPQSCHHTAVVAPEVMHGASDEPLGDLVDWLQR